VDRENLAFSKNMYLVTDWYLLPLMSLQVNLITFMKYRVIQNDCQGFNNLSYTIHLR